MPGKERNYGVDLLKVLAMLLIVCGHLLSHGGCLTAAESLSARWELLNLLYAVSLPCVNVYVMLTGYLYQSRRTRPETLIGLWFVAAFYALLVPALLKLTGAEIGLRDILKGFFPVMTVQSWFFTAYFGLFFLIPALNRIVDDRRLALSTLAGALFCFSLLPTLGHDYELFGLSGGYSLLWLTVLYLCGAWLGRYGPPAWLTNRRASLLLLLGVLLTLTANNVLYVLRDTPIGHLWPRTFFYNYSSPMQVLCAACAVCLFTRLKLRAPALPQLAALTFGVYLLHDNNHVREHLIAGRFAPLTELPAPLMLLSLLGSTLAIFALCAALDWLRAKLFLLLRVPDLSKKLADRISKLSLSS